MKTLRLKIIDSYDQLVAIHPVKIGTNNWPELFPYAPEVNLRIARSRTALFLEYEVRGEDLRAQNLEDNGRQWEDSACEFFVCPDVTSADSTTPCDYFNFEVNCIGTLLCAKGPDRHNRVLQSAEAMKQIVRHTSLERKAYDEPGLHQWTVGLEIPFAFLGLDPANLPERIKGNFCKCAALTPHLHYLSWMPIEAPRPDFHRPECFGVLVLS